MRILTYNVHRWVGTDRQIAPGRTAEVIAACAPDVVALQEVRLGHSRSGGLDQAEKVARRLGMEMHFQPTIRMFGDQFGLAVLTGRPSRLVKAGPLPNLPRRGPPIETRCAMWVEIETDAGPVHVLNTHLALLSRRERLLQVDALLGEDWMGHGDCHGPAVLVGDLNMGPRSAAYGLLASRLRDAQLAAPGSRRHNTFHTRLPVRSIDHIFVGGTIGVSHVEAVRTPLARVASDHLPLVADLRLPAERPTRLRPAASLRTLAA